MSEKWKVTRIKVGGRTSYAMYCTPWQKEMLKGHTPNMFTYSFFSALQAVRKLNNYFAANGGRR